MKTGLLFLILFKFLLVHNEVTQVGCLLWENSFVQIHKNSISKIQQEFIFTVHSRQRKGWMGFGIFKKKQNFEDSIQVVGFLPNSVIQLENHTTITKRNIIFGETFQNTINNAVDGTFTFVFKLNSTDVIGKSFFAFSNNYYETPIIENGSIAIPKHYSFSKFQYFNINETNFIPICRFGLNIPARFAVAHPAGYITVTIIYIIILMLFIQFHNDQPLKSRFIGPYIGLCGVFINLVFEMIFSILPYEKSSADYCIIAIITYTVLEMG